MGILKDLPRGTTSYKVLRDKAFNIAKILECDPNIKDFLLQ